MFGNWTCLEKRCIREPYAAPSDPSIHRYMPAELLLEGKMSKATDMYSFAMLMHELVTGKQLFEHTAQSQVLLSFGLDQVAEGTRLQMV